MKLFKTLLVALTLGLGATPLLAQALAEGKHFVRIQIPQPTEVAGKVEVIEFFWYGCSHCNDFEPLLKQWIKKQPADVHVRKVPAIFRPEWAVGARTFYALEELKLLDKLSDKVFHAIHRERINLNDEKTLFDWIGNHGVDRQKFQDMYKSFAVDGKVRKSMEMTQEYGFSGVPAVVVGGKYMPAPGLGGYPEMLRVIDGLIGKNRGEIKKK